MGNYSGPKLYHLQQVLRFGKHKGKTIHQVHFGIKPIPDEDLKQIFFAFYEQPVPTSHDFWGPWSQLTPTERDELRSPGLKAFFRYQPDPSYIDWLILNTEFALSHTDHERLLQQEVEVLTSFAHTRLEDGGVFEPIWKRQLHEISQVVRETLEQKLDRLEDLEAAGDSYPKSDWEVWEEERERDNRCPACDEPMPCFCNYYLKRF